MSTALTFEREPIEVPSGRQGMWWFLGSEVVTFGGILACYVVFRLRHPEWGAEAGHTLLWAGATNTLVLLTSSMFVALAHHAAHLNDARTAARYMLYSLLLGILFVGIKSYEYSHEIHEGLNPLTNLFWSFYFFITGLHLLHVVVGLILIAMVWLQVGQGKMLHRVEIVGIYWHFVDLVWIFVFPLLYIAS